MYLSYSIPPKSKNLITAARERVYNDKIKYWRVRAGQFANPCTTPHSSSGSPRVVLNPHRHSYDSGIDVRSQASSGRESWQSTITNSSASPESVRSESSTGTRGQGILQLRVPPVRQLQPIPESMEVDIDDEDLAGHTIINDYNSSHGEVNIAVNLVKYITLTYIKLEERDAAGDSLLHTAAAHGLPLVVLALLKQGANPNSINSQGQSIWFSTAKAFDNVECKLSQEWDTELHHQRGRLVDCLSLLEQWPGFSTVQSSAPSTPDSPGKEKDHHLSHTQATATSSKNAFWPW